MKDGEGDPRWQMGLCDGKGKRGEAVGGGWGDYDANYSVRQCGPAIYYNINAEAKLQIGG